MRIWFAVALFFVPCANTWGDIVIFELGNQVDGSAIDGVTSGSLIRNGVTATFTANNGTLNATGSGFGINAEPVGDVTYQLDARSGISEFITITFDVPVEFMQLSLGNFTESERASLTVGLNTPWLLAGTAAGTDIYDFTHASFPSGNTLAVGQSLVIGYSFAADTDNGFSLEGFRVNTVPEPSLFGVSCLAASICQLRQRRRNQS